MKRENLAILVAILSFIFWVGENIYFGWNREPLTALEGFCDALALFGLFLSFLIKPSSNDNSKTYNINGDLKLDAN